MYLAELIVGVHPYQAAEGGAGRETGGPGQGAAGAGAELGGPGAGATMAEGERDSERGEKTTAEDQLKKVCWRFQLFIYWRQLLQ